MKSSRGDECFHGHRNRESGWHCSWSYWGEIMIVLNAIRSLYIIFNHPGQWNASGNLAFWGLNILACKTSLYKSCHHLIPIMSHHAYTGQVGLFPWTSVPSDIMLVCSSLCQSHLSFVISLKHVGRKDSIPHCGNCKWPCHRLHKVELIQLWPPKLPRVLFEDQCLFSHLVLSKALMTTAGFVLPTVPSTSYKHTTALVRLPVLVVLWC